MSERQENTSGEVKRLQRCLNDMVSVLALPAMWSGSQPSQIVHILLDALLEMLGLDLVYACLQDPAGGAPIEVLKIAPSAKWKLADEIHKTVNQWFGDDPQKWPSLLRASIADEDVSIVSSDAGCTVRLGSSWQDLTVRISRTRPKRFSLTSRRIKRSSDYTKRVSCWNRSASPVNSIDGSRREPRNLPRSTTN